MARRKDHTNVTTASDYLGEVGFIAVPNPIFDTLLNAETAAEKRALADALLVWQYGMRKKDIITASGEPWKFPEKQFVTQLGIPRRRVQLAVQLLVKLGLAEVTRVPLQTNTFRWGYQLKTFTNRETQSGLTRETQLRRTQPRQTPDDLHISEQSSNSKQKGEIKPESSEKVKAISVPKWAVAAAAKFRNSLLKHSIAPPQRSSDSEWSQVLDKLHRLDGYTEADITDVLDSLFDFRHPNHWWVETSNIRSLLKLRKTMRDSDVTYFEHLHQRHLSHLAEAESRSRSRDYYPAGNAARDFIKRR